MLCEEEESYLVEMAKQCAEWNFPFTSMDLRLFIKQYLDKKGEPTKFKNNMPTEGFVTAFLDRHPEIKLRKTNLIKRARAAVSAEELEEFFKNYEKVAEGIPPENIYNYDESCFRDNPGSKKCLFPRGSKYCERIMNSSKSSISVMLMVSADGSETFVMVCYKAANVYSSWTRYGPKGCLYSSSTSGWFDIFQFERFFFEVALPKLKKKKGRKLMIGDNHSSHFSPSIIEACREHEIAFVCLPPNSTNLMQVPVFKLVQNQSLTHFFNVQKNLGFFFVAAVGRGRLQAGEGGLAELPHRLQAKASP